MSMADRSSTLRALIGTAVLVAISGSAAANAADSTSTTDATAVNDAAADNTASADGELQNVVVTARRRTERAQDVPIPIATVGGGDLASFNQTRLEDLSEHLPSTNIQYANPRQSSIAVRGLGNNPADDALESSVGVYVDGVYLG